jgi:hypothetical protein
MTVEVDNYRFDFPGAVDAYKFDETDALSPHYHGVTVLKAVDVLVELPTEYVFIEIKTYDDLTVFKKEGKTYDDNEARKYLIRTLSRKYRETFLYRYCEGKIDKPIYYVCLLNLDAALKGYCRKELAKRIPVGKASRSRWHKELLGKTNLFVVDEDAWNRNLTRWGSCQYIGG